MAEILIVEDDNNLRLLLQTRLKPRYSVLCAANGVEALHVLESKSIDVVVTDVMMPALDGYSLVETMRSQGLDIPVIMLTAKDKLSDKGQGFFAGCDDYMTKPVNFEELIWRIDALLRRSKIAGEGKIVIGAVTADSSNFTVTRGDEVCELPAKEFRLLYLLLSYPNKIFTKENILDKVWGYACESDETTVRTHINRLRSKFESYPEFDIVTIRGVGYKAVIKK
ncbi:MAG: response regulator transcription factor [Clostridia bacterium]|nr:response regulator transcription factor [Clostridia bacterium]